MIEKSQYKSLGEWCVAKPSDYNSAKRQGLLDIICEKFGWERNKPAGYWTKKKCIEEASKYETSNNWKRGNASSYQAASKGGWLKECSVNFKIINKPTGYWTKERCIESAKNYNTKAEWSRGCSSSNSAARKRGWYEECVGHMVHPLKVWTKTDCIKEAKKHNSKADWRRYSRYSLRAARKKGWLEECCKHMKK